MAWWGAFTPFVTALYVYEILLVPMDFINVVVLLVGLVPEIELFRLWQRPVWHASFYTDFVELRGRKFARGFWYWDIQRVMHRKGVLGPQSLTLSLKGEQEPMAIHANPVNEELQMNLNEWLAAKTQADTQRV